jgi:hypothetical protein
MGKYWKYLKYLFQLKDISDIFKEENTAEKPWYLSKRFIGAVITFIFGAFSIGVSEGDIAQLTDQILLVSGVVPSVYGLIMLVIGLFQKIRRMKNEVTSA